MYRPHVIGCYMVSLWSLNVGAQCDWSLYGFLHEPHELIFCIDLRCTLTLIDWTLSVCHSAHTLCYCGVLPFFHFLTGSGLQISRSKRIMRNIITMLVFWLYGSDVQIVLYGSDFLNGFHDNRLCVFKHVECKLKWLLMCLMLSQLKSSITFNYSVYQWFVWSCSSLQWRFAFSCLFSPDASIGSLFFTPVAIGEDRAVTRYIRPK